MLSLPPEKDTRNQSYQSRLRIAVVSGRRSFATTGNAIMPTFR